MLGFAQQEGKRRGEGVRRGPSIFCKNSKLFLGEDPVRVWVLGFAPQEEKRRGGNTW